MDMFYAFLGKENAEKIRLAVMDMWKPFRKSTQRHAPQAAILFDKFLILRHLGEALEIRKAEYARVTGPKRKFIKGQNTSFSRTGKISRPKAKKAFGFC